MNADDLRALESFPMWLRSLGDDAVALAEILAADATPEPTRRALAAGLNYLFKSMDLIPDGLDDIGYLDDAFVLRVAARQALAFEGARLADARDTLDRLAGDARLVESFLGRDAERLSRYVKSLWMSEVRGRSVEALATNGDVRAAMLSDVRSFATNLTAPTFTRDERSLVKLRAFLTTKLPMTSAAP